MFDLDDLLGNTVGTMIGYGLFTMVVFIGVKIKKEKQSRKMISVIALQLPFLMTVSLFSIIFSIYASLELGNNPYRYIETYDKNLIKVSLAVELTDKSITLPTYEIQTLTVDEAIEKGSQLLKNLGTTIDESRTDVYENSLIIYSSDNNRYSLSIEYKGGIYRLTNFEALYPDTEDGSEPKPITGLKQNTIRESLKDAGIVIPNECEFEILDNGQYRFTASMIKTENGIMDGTIECTYYCEQGMGTINYSIITCTPYKEYAAISEQQAYEKITNGEFGCFSNETLNIEVKSCTLVYIIDSKGYYQPTYQFECLVNGNESDILIPAYEKV